MAPNTSKTARFFSKVLTKNRLIILNEDTFEEIFSLKLNWMNVFVVVSLSAIFLVAITTFIIAFTPLREFIPGYSSSKLKKDAIVLALKSDSLTVELKKNEAYIQSIQKVLNGQMEYAKFNKDSIMAEAEEAEEPINMEASEEEIALRKEVIYEEKKAKSKK